MIPNLLPRDTRIAEIASGMAMMMVAIWLFTAGPTHHNFLAPPIFWGTVIAITGGLQLWALLLHPSLEALRAATALTNGGWWVWAGLQSAEVNASQADWAAFALGLANLYAFAIATLYIRAKWEK